MSVSYLTRFNRGRLRKRGVNALWNALPMLTVFAFMLPSGLPKHLTLITEVLPPLGLMCLFYWGVARAEPVSLLWVCAAGLVQDVLISTPFGSSALLWMLLHFVVAGHRKEIAAAGFAGTWIIGSVLLLALLLLQWALVAYALHGLPRVLPPVVQWLLGVLCYPALHAGLHRIEQYFHRKYWYILKPA